MDGEEGDLGFGLCGMVKSIANVLSVLSIMWPVHVFILLYAPKLI